MANIEDLRVAIEKLRKKELKESEEGELMRNMDNWCIVHTTKYMPRTGPDGKMYIPTTAMATDFESTRSTVHVTLNHVVESHAYGSWDDASIVVFAPYKDVTDINSNPVMVALKDTYWSLDPDKGLVLPESAYIVKPDNNGPLFQIGENYATYKTDHFTEDEIAEIESMLEPNDRARYERYKNGDVKESELRAELANDKRLAKAYERAKDKKAFVRGLFEESRFNILSQFLRDKVVYLAMNQMGFIRIRDLGNLDSIPNKIIENTAIANGVPGTSSNEEHCGSVYSEIEDLNDHILQVLELGGPYSEIGIFKADIKSIYDIIVERRSNRVYRKFIDTLILSLINNTPIDFLGLSEQNYRQRREQAINDLVNYQEDLSRNSKEIDEWQKLKELKDYNQNLWESVRRHCERLSSKYQMWMAKLVKHPEYNNLVQKLRIMYYGPNVVMNDTRTM